MTVALVLVGVGAGIWLLVRRRGAAGPAITITRPPATRLRLRGARKGERL